MYACVMYCVIVLLYYCIIVLLYYCIIVLLYYCIWMYDLRAIAIVRRSNFARLFVDGFRFDTRDGCETGG